MNSNNFIHPNSKTFNYPCRQYFSLPYDVINYILHNPLSADGLLKLQKTCKYFFAKKKIVVADSNIIYYTDFFGYSIESKHYDLPDGKTSYWLTGELSIAENYKNLSSVVYRCTLKSLTLKYLNLTLNEMDFLLDGGKTTFYWLSNANIYNENGNIVSCEAILAKLPNLQTFFYGQKTEIFSSKTFQKMNELKFNCKLERFRLRQFNVSESSDFSFLCNFIKNNAAEKAEFIFSFQGIYAEKCHHTFLNMLKKNTLLTWIKENKVKIEIELSGVSTYIN